MWRSVLTQQLQADMLACEMASQLLNIAPDPEAKLYYSTMVQDESRHTEAWLRLIGQVGGEGERDPYLDRLAHMTLDADTLEEKVFLMQVFYERLIILRREKEGGMEAMLMAMATGYDYRKYQKVKAVERRGR